MRIAKIIAMGMVLSTMRGGDAKQDIHSAFLSIGHAVILWEKLHCDFEIVDKPGTQNAFATTFPDGSRRIEVDEAWYAGLPAGHIWGIVYVMGHEIGHFYVQDRYKEWERTATTEQRQLAADYFAGHVSAAIGLTKEQATWVLVDNQHHGLDRDDWGARIRSVEAGWTAGKQRRPYWSPLP